MGDSCALVSVETDAPLSSSMVIIIGPGHGGGGTSNRHLQLATGLQRLADRKNTQRKSRPGVGSVFAAGPRRSKGTDVRTRSGAASFSGPGVFLIEPRRSGESPI